MDNGYKFKVQVNRLNSRSKIEHLLEIPRGESYRYSGRSFYDGVLDDVEVQIQFNNLKPTLLRARSKEGLERVFRYVIKVELPED